MTYTPSKFPPAAVTDLSATMASGTSGSSGVPATCAGATITAPKTGKYKVSGNREMNMSNSTTESYSVGIFVDGVQKAAIAVSVGNAGEPDFYYGGGISWVGDVTAGQVIELRCSVSGSARACQNGYLRAVFVPTADNPQ